MRFENRFEYELAISDDLLFNKAMVSPMITQPFIENAIEHGQLHTVKGGKIAATSKFMVKLADYKIERPAVVSDKIAETIEITVDAAYEPKK
jgi:LytS/YehU family sensor histidine kinase